MGQIPAQGSLRIRMTLVSTGRSIPVMKDLVNHFLTGDDRGHRLRYRRQLGQQRINDVDIIGNEKCVS